MPFYEIGSHNRKVFVMQDKKCTILFQGDSITDCGRASCGGAGFSNDGLGPGYPGLIAARLLCNRPEVSWKFINRGISGSRTVDLYARWKIDGINLKPDIITILVGINDTWHRYCGDNGVELERAERIYRSGKAEPPWNMRSPRSFVNGDRTTVSAPIPLSPDRSADFS